MNNQIIPFDSNLLVYIFLKEVSDKGSNHTELQEPSNLLLMWKIQRGNLQEHEHPPTLSSKSHTNKYIVSYVYLLQFHDSLIGIEVKVNEQNAGRVMNKQVSDHCIQMRKVRLVL